ncbi:MAG TPA: hypothetical protein DDZ96_06090 [Porphyromonadaceae bacterium]|jgi:hypothetical protein|uniref:hypothetical protein n=1 Tax=Limibacterium fermenti TaxID=3229863 RepID=UPI000E95049F|nr:hypothetical protein [Porphyromonadaceae bacterium]HBL33378.1 hypothetical protein [Porphyromonadaceae bacterium]HBX21368.1 hypothetical protein [Porphyromonadaceae bacterium]
MTRDQINHSNTLHTVENLLTVNVTKIADMPALQQAHVKLTGINTNIGQYQQEQAVDIKGLTKLKQLKKADLENRTIKVSDALHAYAVAQKDVKLASLSDRTLSEVKSIRESDLPVTAKAIYTAANPLAEALVPFKTTADEITALGEAAESFPKHYPDRETLIAQRKQATSNLKAKIKEGMELLHNEIDILMLPFRASDPTFYGEYRNARSIINIRGGKPDNKDEQDKK